MRLWRKTGNWDFAAFVIHVWDFLTNLMKIKITLRPKVLSPGLLSAEGLPADSFWDEAMLGIIYVNCNITAAGPEKILLRKCQMDLQNLDEQIDSNNMSTLNKLTRWRTILKAKQVNASTC